MIINIPKLKGKIVESGKTQEVVADTIGIDRSTFYRKMRNGGEGFTIGEIHRLTEAIPLTKEESIDIFFC